MREFKTYREFSRHLFRWKLVGWIISGVIAGFLFTVFFVSSEPRPDSVTLIILLSITVMAEMAGKWIIRKISTISHFPAYSRIEIKNPTDSSKKLDHIYAIAYNPCKVELVIPLSLLKRKNAPESKIREDIEKYVQRKDYNACYSVIYIEKDTL